MSVNTQEFVQQEVPWWRKIGCWWGLILPALFIFCLLCSGITWGAYKFVNGEPIIIYGSPEYGDDIPSAEPIEPSTMTSMICNLNNHTTWEYPYTGNPADWWIEMDDGQDGFDQLKLHGGECTITMPFDGYVNSIAGNVDVKLPGTRATQWVANNPVHPHGSNDGLIPKGSIVVIKYHSNNRNNAPYAFGPNP